MFSSPYSPASFRKEGKEVVISNQEKETPRIERLLKEGKLAYISKATLPSEPTNSTQGNQSTILGGAILSESKDTTTEPITQEVAQENLQPTPQSTAEGQVEVSAVENEDADEQTALSPEERAAQVEDPNSILFTTMLDNAYRSGDAHRIDYNERFVRALLNRAVNVDGLKRLIQNQTGESSDPEHNAILQRRYAFIREVATSRINDIEAEQTKSETAEPTPRGPVDMNILQLTMSDEEFNSLLWRGEVFEYISYACLRCSHNRIL